MNRLMGLALAGLVIAGLGGCAKPQFKRPGMMSAGSFWGDFPEGRDPHVAGKKVVENLLARPEMEGRNYGIIYPEVCVGYGSMRFAAAAGDKDLLARLIERYNGMLVQGDPPEPPRRQGNGWWIKPENGTAGTMIPGATHVDRSVFGTLAFESYLHTKDPAYLAIGKKSADDQWTYPDLSNANEQERARVEALKAAGLTEQSRWWIDDMFMISAVQAQAYRATKDKVYLDRLATQMAAYLDKLQQANGLFYHADDSHFYWGRGCGWVAAGLTELLSDLPADHPKHARILEGYRKMMAGLLANQAESGMWRQLVDVPESWEETSGSGMFTYAMAMGVRKGWLPEPEYKVAAKKAWVALAGYLNDDGAVRECCVGTNKGYTVQYYMDRARPVGDKHGQAAFIWAAYAMLD